MITIINKQRKIVVNETFIKKTAHKMLMVLGYEKFDLGIYLTTNATVRKYNREFRKKDKPTDILSFPFHPDLVAGQRIVVMSPEDENLGDIIISLEYVKKEAPNWGRSFEEHLTALLAHGIAHLLNYDHITDEEYRVMSKVERKLLKTVE
ncbi:rRNA maturation RNase YbeY [Candidatus Babeliales bacterium]|nr:rRNA maturation RNase YbeY [Candidatus Babeliales bacterium]